MTVAQHQHVADAVQRLQLVLERDAPVVAPAISEWMRRLAGDSEPEAYFTHDLAFPTLALPVWVEQSLCVESDAAFQADLAYSSINGYYFIRMIDNVMDGEATVEVKLLPALAIFHTEFEGVYRTHFEVGHPFWELLRKVWFGTAEAAIQDSKFTHISLAMFEAASAQKVRAALIPAAAVCHRYARPDLIGPWSELVYRLGKWHQMQNDVFDWYTDFGRGNMTYFLSEAAVRKQAAESTEAWVIRTGFAQGCETLRSWLHDAQSSAAALNCPPLLRYIEERSTHLERRVADVHSGLETLTKLAGALA